MLPKTLKNIDFYAFGNCKNLKVIYVEEGCGTSLCDVSIPYSTKVGPLPEAMLGNMRIWDLRRLKDVVIPDGVERIGNYWFWGSDI